jgi:drug/metabolite transporter (DMT)-like permease
MLIDRIGEFAALGTALCWTVTALSFESAGKRIGALTVNIIRLAMASLLFAAYGWIVRGHVLPLDASGAAWGWLTLSGLVGFVFGDLFLFQAFVDIGARTSMLIYSSVPVLTAILGRFVLDERLGTRGIVGIALTVLGIVLVVLKRPAVHEQPAPHAVPPEPESEGNPDAAAILHPSRLHLRGALFAFGGALGQAGGLILGRVGAGVSLNAFAATQIRALAGLAGFALVFTVVRRWKQVGRAVRDRAAMARVATGATFGPFLGVSLGLFAAQNTSAGVASTIMALVPVLIIVPSVVIFKERVRPREVVGALVAVAGVALLFL